MTFVHLVGPAEPITRSSVRGKCRRIGMSDEDSERHFQRMLKLEWWGNDTYTVSVDRDCELKYFNDPTVRLVHLSIHRRDRAPCTDWRDFQRIKNDIVGEEIEAVQLHPAQSRVVDTANEYHLWCLIGAAQCFFPFGFAQGLLNDTIELRGSKQRKLEEP
jgi:hypothetical protein